MPLIYRNFTVILIIAFASFFLLKKLTENLITPIEFKQWRKSWLLIVSAGFLSFNFWIFALFTLIYGRMLQRKNELVISIFHTLIFALPNLYVVIPGFGILNYLFTITYHRLIVIAIILPTFLYTLRNKEYLKFGKNSTDKFIIAYGVLTFLLSTRDTTLLDASRSLLYFFLELVIPYHVLSRTLLKPEDFKKVITACFFGFILAGSIGIFEYLKEWLLFFELNSLWGSTGGGQYLYRAGALRASSTFGHSLGFGYVASVLFGLYLYLSQFILNGFYRKIGWLILIGTLIAPIARASWVATILLIAIFLLTGANPIGKLMKFISIIVVGLSIGISLPGGDKIYDILPFVGTVDSFNVEYREQLTPVSLGVIAKYPLFGQANYNNDPDMQVLRQGENIIDMLNVYLDVALSYGLVGEFIFLGIFISALLKLYTAIRKSKRGPREFTILGRVLFSCIISTLFTFTSSGWGSMIAIGLLLGISTAYCQYISSITKRSYL